MSVPRCILMVSPQALFAPSGTPFNVRQMCRALGELGYEIELLSFPHGEELALPALRHHRTPRLPFVASVPVGFSPQKLLYDGLLAASLLHRVRRHEHLAIHAIEEAAFFAAPVAAALRLPLVVDVDSDLAAQLRDHPSAAVRLLAAPAARLRRRALRRAACAITVAPHLSALVRREAPQLPVFEIPDTPLPEALEPPAPETVEAFRRRFNPEGRRLFVYTGNFDRRQGLELLLGAWARARMAERGALLLLVGGEPAQQARLEARARELGIAQAVRLAGRHPAAAMPAFMALAEVLLSPRLEPHVTPLKIYSYMASGRPILATDLPTHRAVLDDSTALLVPPDEEGMARGLERALSEDLAPLGRRARARVLAQYGFEGFRARLAATYRHVEAEWARLHPGRVRRETMPS